ncbi:MAG TPA: hypothetical protein VKX28_08705 [Xanthobacteraceae bacterium]|jgi:hypothetical protein|nr:hypothetical protein [Xanthobacteraceae bacterium]
MSPIRPGERLRLVAVAALVLIGSASIVFAQAQADPGEIHGLRLGLEARRMSTDAFGEFACGSNGGPPRANLEGFADFAKCRAEASGLREVYVRFDDEAEYIAKAIGDDQYTRNIGTRIAGHPVILSVLFDDGGILRGIRAVTDPRAAPAERRMAHLMRLAVINHYGPEGWTCADEPAAAGETPVGGIFIKQRCHKTTAARDITVEAHFLRKPGQSGTDRVTGEYRGGQYESWTRFELMDPAYHAP